jgi:hypothetical protein
VLASDFCTPGCFLRVFAVDLELFMQSQTQDRCSSWALCHCVMHQPTQRAMNIECGYWIKGYNVMLPSAQIKPSVDLLKFQLSCVMENQPIT